MKTLAVLLLQAGASAAAPQGLFGGLFGKAAPTSTSTAGHSHAASTAAPVASAAPAAPAVAAPPAAAGAPAAAPSCRVLASDKTWPADAVWKAAMPMVERTAATAGKKHPEYRLDAMSYADVQAAVKFAKQYNIRLSVLNSGHDFLGRNDAPSGLVIVTTNLKGVRVSTNFRATAQGAPAVNSDTVTNVLGNYIGQPFVTFGAGFSTQQLNDQLHKSKLFALGAAHGEVSVAGGWGQTAGHTPLGPHYGLGVDQVAEYKVVTADGELRVANSATNSDLFWALRGGGGGTFGVVVEATIKAYPTPKMQGTQFFINTTNYNDKKSIYAPVAWLHTQFPALVNKGISGYYYVHPNAIRAAFFSVGDQATKAASEATWNPIVEKMASFPGINKQTAVSGQEIYDSYKAFFDKAFGAIDGSGAMTTSAGSGMGGPVVEEAGHSHGGAAPVATSTVAAAATAAASHSHGGRDVMDTLSIREFFRRHEPGADMTRTESMGTLPMDSRLLGANHFSASNFAQVLEDLMPPFDQGQLRGNLVGGGKVSTNGAGGDTSVHPSWRKALTHLIQTGIGTSDAAALRKFAPEMGAYANEATGKQPNWKETYWGSNYARLSTIKKKYDPGQVFWVTPGIDADLMAVDRTGRLCKAAGSTNAAAFPPDNDNKNMAPQWRDANHDGPIFPILNSPAGPVKNPNSKSAA